MDDNQWMIERFEEHRPHLRAVAYRMLGSVSDADDAVQEAWIRLDRSDTSDVENLGGWLTTVVARVCLNVLRSRTTRRTEPLDEPLDEPGERLPDPVIALDHHTDPEQQALLADSVGLALLVVLDTLSPAERLAFVLHDMFAVPFEEIAPIVGRSPEATRQLASRARRRARGAAPTPDPDLDRQREVVEAFFGAAREGNFAGLVAVLHPDVVMRIDAGAARGGTLLVRGAEMIAGRATTFADPARVLHPALVNGAAGVVVTLDRQVVSVMAFTVSGGRIVEIETLSDPDRLAGLHESLGLGA